MTWTSEYPTKPGFYWIRNYAILGKGETIQRDERTMAYVEKVRGGLSFWLFQWPDILSRGQVMSAEWQGPIEPEVEGRCAPAVYNFETLNLACRDCNKAGRSFVSWPLDTVDGNPVYGIICRNCWIKRLTPEQRKVYMV